MNLESPPLASAKRSPLVQVTFGRSNPQDFASTIKQRADQYFQANELSKNANAYMIAKSAFYLGSWLALYIAVISGHFSAWSMLFMMMLLGFVGAQIGFNVGHDAIHGAYSRSSRINTWVGYTFEFIGANSYTWKIRHN